MIFQKKTLHTEAPAEHIQKLKEAIARADAVIIGAGAGLSTSAGFTYSGVRFEKHFSDFGARYGFSDMYSGGFYPYGTLEEHWAYWSRNIMVNRYTDAPKSVYRDLLALVRGKDYFVLTTNVDHCFQKAGFDKTRLYYTQGDYGLFQCSEPCCQKTYDNEEAVRIMVASQALSADCSVQEGSLMRVPEDLVPRCPVCGKPMSMNLRTDGTFVQDDGWYEAAGRYEEFLNTRRAADGGNVLFLEIGVGANTPGIIKYPFWQMTYANRRATYACINFGEAAAPQEIQRRAVCIDADIGAVLTDCLRA